MNNYDLQEAAYTVFLWTVVVLVLMFTVGAVVFTLKTLKQPTNTFQQDCIEAKHYRDRELGSVRPIN